MKNIVLAVSTLFGCVVATVVGAAIYFSVTFGLLSWLAGTSTAKLGAAIGTTTGALGFPAGCVVFGILFWDDLVREDGGPDWVARAIALIIGLPLALIPLVVLASPAMSAVNPFKALGLLAVVGFVGLVGWIKGKVRKRA